jgi:transposase
MTKHREYPIALKQAALARMASGESVGEVARDLQLRGRLLYAWRDKVRQGGSVTLRGRGRPRKRATAEAAPVAVLVSGEMGEGELARAQQRVAELERKIGQQQVDLDFFRQALRHVRETRRPSAAPGVVRSTRSFKR